MSDATRFPERATEAMTLSREVLSVGTEWAESGTVRFRRRIVSETRTIEVTVRREELVIETQDVEFVQGVGTGSAKDGPVGEPPRPVSPLVIVLQEEVPEVTMQLRPYEKVTVTTSIVDRAVRVTSPVRHEEADVAYDAPVATRP